MFNGKRLMFVFKQSSAWKSMLLVVVHQAIIASSAIFLTAAAENYQSGKRIEIYLACYLASMLVPYIPGCLSLIELQKWINATHEDFSRSLVDALKRNPGAHADMRLKGLVKSVMSKNSFAVLKEYVGFLHELLSFSLNSGFSLLVMAFLLPMHLLSGYVASGVFCFFVIVLMRRLIVRPAAELEYSFIAYSDTLGRAWENISIGNKYNRNLWATSVNESASRFYQGSNKLQYRKQSGNLLLAFASLGPTMYLVFSVATSNSIEPAVLAAIVVNLTRIFLILNAFSTLVYKFLDFSALHARLQMLLDILKDVADCNTLLPPSEAVCLDGVEVSTANEILAKIDNSSAARFLLSGKNGGGKSNLMRQLHLLLGDKSFFLPAHCEDMNWVRDLPNMSTGQRARACLEELVDVQDIDYYLLDEWDANLDAAAANEMNSLIEKLSHKGKILEIRH